MAANPVALETFLREKLRDSTPQTSAPAVPSSPSLPPHLLFEISSWNFEGRGFTPNPDNYLRLISAALELPEAVFITHNCDTLLDRRLFAYAPLAEMESYIDARRNWSLIKPHGYPWIALSFVCPARRHAGPSSPTRRARRVRSSRP